MAEATVGRGRGRRSRYACPVEPPGTSRRFGWRSFLETGGDLRWVTSHRPPEERPSLPRGEGLRRLQGAGSRTGRVRARCFPRRVRDRNVPLPEEWLVVTGARGGECRASKALPRSSEGRRPTGSSPRGGLDQALHGQASPPARRYEGPWLVAGAPTTQRSG